MNKPNRKRQQDCPECVCVCGQGGRGQLDLCVCARFLTHTNGKDGGEKWDAHIHTH